MAPSRVDIAVLGATGFTGKITAAYLAEHLPKNMTMAIAGRNTDKLEAVRRHLLSLNPGIKDSLKALQVDTSNAASLNTLASSTKVLITTVGPFWQHIPVVEACVNNKTHYLDCTGETHFIKKVIEDLHDRAEANKVIVIPSCAFEACLPDVGAFLAARHIKGKGKDVGAVKYSIQMLRGAGVSGGTIYTLSTTLALGSKVLRPIDQDASCLEPKPNQIVSKSSSVGTALAPQSASKWPLVKYDPEFKAWQSWFLPATGNIRYVRRSAALLGYGSTFAFHETLAHRHVIVAGVVAAAQAMVLALMMLPFVRWIVEKAMPQGSGPSEKQLRSGRFEVKIYGESADKETKCMATMRYEEDPGYKGTAVLLAESAICLVQAESSKKDIDLSPFGSKKSGGVLTAASALGNTLVDRLERAGFAFDVTDL